MKNDMCGSGAIGLGIFSHHFPAHKLSRPNLCLATYTERNRSKQKIPEAEKAIEENLQEQEDKKLFLKALYRLVRTR